MVGKGLTFTNPAQLNALSTIPFIRTSGIGKLRLGGNITEHPERTRWEKELNRHYHACGCDTGAKGLLISLLAGSTWAGYSYSQGSWGAGFAAGVALSITIGGAMIGKLSGLMRANRKLKQTISEIQSQWQHEKKTESEHWSCG